MEPRHKLTVTQGAIWLKQFGVEFDQDSIIMLKYIVVEFSKNRKIRLL